MFNARLVLEHDAMKANVSTAWCDHRLAARCVLAIEVRGPWRRVRGLVHRKQRSRARSPTAEAAGIRTVHGTVNLLSRWQPASCAWGLHCGWVAARESSRSRPSDERLEFEGAVVREYKTVLMHHSWAKTGCRFTVDVSADGDIETPGLLAHATDRRGHRLMQRVCC